VNLMSDALFQIRFNATMTGEFSYAVTKQRFGRFFRLGNAAIERMFSGRDFVLKKGLSENDAMRFAMKVAEAGCECVIESMPGGGPLEQRKETADRRTRYRRNPRASAMIPDRRREIRRQADVEYFEDLILKSAIIPVSLRSYPAILR
jgi:hypothetical protein